MHSIPTPKSTNVPVGTLVGFLKMEECPYLGYRFGRAADYNSPLMARCLAEGESILVPPLQNGEGCREMLRPYAQGPGKGFRNE